MERPDGGVQFNQLKKTFKNYAIIASGPNTPENVAQFIDRNILVALITQEKINGEEYMHMVTVIGYDGKYYYTAAGSPDCGATIYDKKEFEKINRLFIIDRINTPYKAPKK